jgi:hypothetical protein
MMDIVERLRIFFRRAYPSNVDEGSEEITHLRAEVERLMAWMAFDWKAACESAAAASKAVGDLRDEVERLRMRDAERFLFSAKMTANNDALRAEVTRLRDEVARLRIPPPTGVTLTDAEREAVAYFGQIDGPRYLAAANTHAAAIRGLLARAAKEDSR